MLKSAGVAGVIVRDNRGRYLLIQEAQPRAYGLWNIPAGHIDDGETPAEAALREGNEETGYTMRLLETEPIYIDKHSNPKHEYFGYLAEIASGDLKTPPEEILRADWFTYAEIIAKELAGKIRAPWIVEAIKCVELSIKIG